MLGTLAPKMNEARKETLTFRAALVGLALVAAAVLYASIHPRHAPKTDDGTQPRLPQTEAPAITR